MISNSSHPQKLNKCVCSIVFYDGELFGRIHIDLCLFYRMVEGSALCSEVKQLEAHDLWLGKFSILIYTMYECERD